MIEINNLTFKYQDAKKNALNNISMKIEDGDFIGIIGESGAGKSTLCNSINALIPHHFHGDYYGNVLVNGKDTFETPPGMLALSVGSVFQDIDSQIINTIVEDEILFGLENFGIPKEEIEGRVSSTLEEVGISDLRYRDISSLSGGQKQKVAIAAILALQPKVLVLDEPTGELDPASSFQIFSLLKKLNQEKGITIIVVEQKIMLLCEFAKKIAVLDKGNLFAYDEVRKVLNNSEKLENMGINIPRVVTLINKLKKENLLKNGENTQLPLNAFEAGEIINKEIIKGKELPYTANDNIDENGSLENAQEILKFDHVHFSYKKEAGLTDINVSINKGDFVAIVGSNGAGKSTFSKLCNGLLKPAKGDVTILNHNTKKVKTSKLAKNIGFLFQNPDRQICCKTVREEIQFSLKNIGLPQEEIEKRTNQIIEEFEFDETKNPFDLSRGQRQKLCLACLISLQSDILILDEPTTGLDYKECMELMGKIKELNKQGTTVIMVCHDMEVVLDFATRLLVMTNGKLLAQGYTKHILSDNELLKYARLAKPQIAETCDYLGEHFYNTFTAEELIEKLEKIA